MAAQASRSALAPEPAPQPDRAPEWVARGTPAPLRGLLEAAFAPDRLALRAIDLVRYASDASPYRRIPRAVALPRDTAEVARLMSLARETGTPLVFRAGGTSLNGQSQTDGILVDVRRHWQRSWIEREGLSVRTQPGVVLGTLNRRLAVHGRRIGPDPASSNIACMGGVIANNSGGMRCGVTQDTYSTLRSLTFVLPCGAVIDTAAPDAETRFAAAAPELAAGLVQIRHELRGEPELAARVRRKFEIKNTTGYRLCAFLDAETPLEIFRRLLIGSEGTLAFVAEAVLDTVPLGSYTSVALAHFADVDAAVERVPELVAAGATATELMVAPTLIAAAWNMPGTPAHWKELDPSGAALLVELRAEEASGLDEPEREAARLLEQATMPVSFSRERDQIEMVWHVREGMQGLLAAMMPPGVSLIGEDVCVPPARVGEAARELQALLGRHGFLAGVAGHASAGNLHFLLNPNLGEQSDLDRYEAFMAELVELIVDRFDGSLKAEHGTGVNMAPFVEREWGQHATELMRRVKRLADPDGILGPGIVLGDEPAAHLQNLKSRPPIDAVATQCIECGYCEPVCPSRDLTTTPRQRIVIRREMARQPAGSAVLEALLEQSDYDALQTCAADGSCASACPVGIDTGALVKDLRHRSHSARSERVARTLADRWGEVERGARAALRSGRLGGGLAGRTVTQVLRSALSHELVPSWQEPMPGPAPPAPTGVAREQAAAVYFPACVNRIFGNSPADRDLPTVMDALVAVSARAGRPLWVPPDLAGLCCATPWSSKGFHDGHALMSTRVAEALVRFSDGGRLPVVVDASSCTLGLTSEVPAAVSEQLREQLARVRLVDSVQWAGELLGELDTRPLPELVLHPACAIERLGLERELLALAGALADRVRTPAAGGCCGTAGDRGMLHPELPRAATAPLAAEMAAAPGAPCACSNRTCEIGISQATGSHCGSLIVLLEQRSRAVAEE